MDEIYRPTGAAFPNNPTRRQRLVVRHGPGQTGLSPSPAPHSKGLGPDPPLRTLLQTTTRTDSTAKFSSWADPGSLAVTRGILFVSLMAGSSVLLLPCSSFLSGKLQGQHRVFEVGRVFRPPVRSSGHRWLADTSRSSNEIGLGEESFWLVSIGRHIWNPCKLFFPPMGKKKKRSKQSPQGLSKGVTSDKITEPVSLPSVEEDVQGTSLVEQEVEVLTLKATVEGIAERDAAQLLPHHQQLPAWQRVMDADQTTRGAEVSSDPPCQPNVEGTVANGEETEPPTAAVRAPAAVPNFVHPTSNGGSSEANQPQAPQVQGQERRGTWANLFRDNRRTKMDNFLQQTQPTGKRLSFDYEDIETVEDSVGYCLVGCFMGRHPGRNGVHAIASRWRVPYKFYMHKSGWVVYRFDTPEDRDKVLRGGPYFAFGIPLFLKYMPRCFLFEEDGRYIPAWIQIHKLPPDCWTSKVLGLIGSEIGKPLYTDKLTQTRERLTYARLLVEVSVIGEKVKMVPITLPTGVQLDLEIIYESMPDFCEECRRIGHQKEDCMNHGREPTQGDAHRNRSQSTRGRQRARYRRVHPQNGNNPTHPPPMAPTMALTVVEEAVPVAIAPRTTLQHGVTDVENSVSSPKTPTEPQQGPYMENSGQFAAESSGTAQNQQAEQSEQSEGSSLRSITLGTEDTVSINTESSSSVDAERGQEASSSKAPLAMQTGNRNGRQSRVRAARSTRG
ncbi:hypothetical protein ZIOFF_061132 [Zingiber officinale]|uniref:DUF4283 domain-containing protein n=1 Tax=Zingiber officinale TaxID=94328 RepID=A0A8J5FBM1_ZINOF|nr:hypothetical protein ZIOFF_061132 [Zingiber officinale]